MDRKKIDYAVSLIKTASDALKGEPIEVAYSGGKDSDVILQLTREAGVPFRAIYKCTTIDPPQTIAHAKAAGAEVMMPRQTFFQLVEKKGFPNRWRRFCCAALKEYKVLDKVIIGIRRDESTKRAALYREPTQCRIYSRNERVEQIYPILEWDKKDLLWFINDRDIRLHPLYYTEDGKVDVTRRIGCLGCPLKTNRKMMEDFKRYPNLIKAYVKAGSSYLEKHRDCPSLQRYGDIYEWFYRHVFCRTNADFDLEIDTLFGRTDCKAELESYFNIRF